jgi:hypothetical protein
MARWCTLDIRAIIIAPAAGKKSMVDKKLKSNYKTPIMIYILFFPFNLTPCVPLSFKGEGEESLERGNPLSYFHSPFP